MIVVVEGPSAAGKTTWCRRHAGRWLPEPRPGPIDQVLRHQMDRWRQAVAEDTNGAVVVLDGDPFKLYYTWASWRVGTIAEAQWDATVKTTRGDFIDGSYGLADLVLYSDPGEAELRGRKERDPTRLRRKFELHTTMRPCFRQWYEAVSHVDPKRVVWEHPDGGLTEDLLALGPRPARSEPALFDRVLASLRIEH